jgi:hypothetical protein
MRRLSLALAAILLAAFALAPAAAAARPAPTLDGLTAPVTGTYPGGTFAGDFSLQEFTVVDGALTAVGNLTGTLTDTVTGATQAVNQQVLLPVTQASGTCDILNLVLGPLDLDLLGLQVHLDQVVLDIVAQSGAGNLLGNLLCAVAGLLDSNGPTNIIANLLNQLLGLLG